MAKISSVLVDVAGAAATINFDDGTSQVITAPLAPAVEGVSLADLQAIETDAANVVTAVQAAEAKITPPSTGAAA